MNFVTTTDLQRRASEIATNKTPSLVLRNGKPESFVVPFFSGYEDFLSDYMEAYEISKNRESLIRELTASEKSGLSALSI